ncbi:MAG: hypothetical protein KME19_15080 [Microcoleus vaginatus WJT46-NPBG5]|jgi:hypothetical protein|nr:hypothetical protein [Microcoleus vaginatus WJT46-NPBG5]
MSLGLPKCGIGAFSNRQEVESALTELKNSDYPMDKVSVVVRDANPEDELTSSESEFVRDKTVGGLAKGALTVGALGSLGGLLVGLSTLAIPGLGAVAVAGSKVALGGLFAGGYYGTAAGGIIGAAIGNGISKEQARIYDEHLAKGDYLVILNGNEDELTRAESILNNLGIQQWETYTTT